MLSFLLFEQCPEQWNHYQENACMGYAKHAEPVEAVRLANAAPFDTPTIKPLALRMLGFLLFEQRH